MDHFIDSLGSRSEALLAVTVFLATAHLLGRPWFRGETTGFTPWERAFLGLTLGGDLLVLGAFPLSFTNLLPTFWVKGPLLAASLVSGWSLFWSIPQVARARPWHILPILLLGVVLLGNGLCPPFAWDDLTYQIAVPSRWLKTGSPQVFLDNPFSGYPGANLFANLLLTAIGGIIAPVLFNGALWLILSLEMFFLVRDNVGPWPATVLALSLGLSLPVVMATQSAYAEPFSLLQTTAIFLILNNRLQKDGPAFSTADVLLLGLFAGMAASVKLTGLIVPAALALFLLGRRFGKDGVLSAFTFSLAVLSVMSIFYLRPLLETGNPAYPFFASFFSEQPSTLATSAYHHELGVKYGSPPTEPLEALGTYIVTPIALAIAPLRELVNYDGYAGLQFLLFYLLAARLAYAGYRGELADARPWVFLGFAGAFYTFWFFTSQQARFLLPTAFSLTMACSFALPKMAVPGRQILLGMILILTVASIPERIVKHVIHGWQVQAGTLTSTDYLYSATADGYLKACSVVLRQTPSHARVLLLYELRGLYLARNHKIGTPFFQEEFFTPPDQFASEVKILEVMRQGKFTHVLIGFSSKDPDRLQSYFDRSKPFQQCTQTLIARGQFRPLWQAEGFGLYEVTTPP